MKCWEKTEYKNRLHPDSNSIYGSITPSLQFNKNIDSEWMAQSNVNFLLLYFSKFLQETCIIFVLPKNDI